MKNLKRALSLVLSAAMMVGMMAIGTAAADFKDADEIDNVAAVEVMNALEIMVGDGQNFNPDNVVTRAEMAVIVCKMLYGNKLNIEQFAGAKKFSDVPAWAEGYVNLASSLDIVAGVGDGKFNPNAPVTTAQASLMICRALGYFQNPAEFGEDYVLASITRGTKLGLFEDLNVATNEGLTRDNVAQLVFNAITNAVPVMYNSNFDIYYNDSTAWTNGVRYDWTDTLGYKNFDLVHKDNGVDAFGNPSTLWGTGTADSTNADGELTAASIAKDDEIVIVNDAPTYTFDGKVTGKALYNTVGKTVAETYAWTVEVDGAASGSVTAIGSGVGYSELVAAKSSTAAWESTGVSSQTAVYLDTAAKTVKVAVVNPYVAEITKIKANDDKFDVTLAVQESTALTDKVITVDDASGFAVEDIVYVTFAITENEIETIALAEKVSGETTAIKSDKGMIEIDGAQYTTAAKWINLDAGNNSALPSVKADIDAYLDGNGNIIGFKAQDAVKNYLYVEDAINALGGLTAKVVFADGTEKKIDVVKIGSTEGASLDAATHALATGSRVFTYSEDDGEYTLTAITSTYQKYTASDSDGAVTKNSATILVDDASTDVVLTATTKTVFVDVKNNVAYTGYANVPSFTGVDMFAVANTDSTTLADIVYILNGVDTTVNDDIFYVKSATYVETKDGNNVLRTYTVYVNGEETTLTTKNMTASANLSDDDSTLQADTLYTVKTKDANGNVTAFDTAKTFAFTTALGLTTANSGNVVVAKDGVLELSGAGGNKSEATGKTKFIYNDKTLFVVVNGKSDDTTDSVEIGSINSINEITSSDSTDQESIAYILNVEDKNDATPLATLVMVVKPYEA